jgi:hypothetical protein
MSQATVYRYSYGKIVEQERGSVVPGVDHAPTSIAPELDDRVLAFCHPAALMRRESTQMLVHEQAHELGAMFLWPARDARGHVYMILGRIRPRPEAGEGGGGRTYTQLCSFAFPEDDWTEHAPEIVTSAPNWLRAEPDLDDAIDRYDPRKKTKPLRLSFDAEQIPFKDTDPLPDPTAAEWRMHACLESADRSLVLGLSQAIPDEVAFCRLLGRALALLPGDIRILVTACAGFANTRPEFAIQLVPDAPPLQVESDWGSGYFEQLSTLKSVGTFAEWRGLIPDQFAESSKEYWSRPDEARRKAAEILQPLRCGLLASAFQGYLAGVLEHCPELPAEEERHAGAGDSRVEIILAATRRIARALKRGEPSESLVRATEAVSNRMNGEAWTRAWSKAKWQDESAAGWIQLVSALRSSPDWDDPKTGIGTIPSFRHLRHILKLRDLIAVHHVAAGTFDPVHLRHTGLNRRLMALIDRGSEHLVNSPWDLVDLAEVHPKAFAGVQGDRRRTLLRTIKQIAVAAGLLAIYAEKVHKDSYGAIAKAATRVLESSFGLAATHGSTALKKACLASLTEFFDHYFRVGTDPKKSGEDGAEFWRQAVLHTILDANEGASFARQVRELFRIVGEWDERRKARRAAAEVNPFRNKHFGVDFERVGAPMKQLFTGFFEGLREREGDKTGLIRRHLRAISIADDLHLAACYDSVATNEHARRDLRTIFSECYQSSLWSALAQSPEATLSAQVLPEAIRVLDLTTQPGVLESARIFGLSLGEKTLRRLVDAGWKDRTLALRALAAMEKSCSEIPGIQIRGASPNTYGRARNPRDERLHSLAQLLFDVTLSWVDESEPRPWLRPLDPKLFSAQPIRAYLAQYVGFPCSIYCGRLTHWSDDDQLRNRRFFNICNLFGLHPLFGSITHTTDPRKEPLIALCATAAWKDRYKRGKKGRASLKALIAHESGNHALDALGQTVQRRDERLLRAVGKDVVFLVDFFTSLDPEGTDALQRRTPPTIIEALLDVKPDQAIRTKCFAIYLARLVMVHGRRLGEPLRTLLSIGNAPAMHKFLLVVEKGWNDLDNENIMWRLDRVLFAMSLIRVGKEGAKDRLSIRTGEVSAFALEDRYKPRIERFFREEPMYRNAFAQAISRAHLVDLEGWPV